LSEVVVPFLVDGCRIRAQFKEGPFKPVAPGCSICGQQALAAPYSSG